MNHWLSYFKQRANITSLDIAIFLRQFATLISAGIPIIQSCDILVKCQEKHALRSLIGAIKHELLSGKNLFYSLRRYPTYFDELTCRLVQMGEQIGKLDTLLNVTADYHEKNRAFNQRIKQALFYPCIITSIALMVTTCLFVFVIPRFAELFQDTHTQLPCLTLWIFYLSAQLRKYGWLIAILFTLCLWVLFHHKHATQKQPLQTIASYLPIAKTCLYKIALVQCARQLAMAVAAGIPITHALTLTANACRHQELTHAIIQLNRKIQAGLSLHQAMGKLTPFPILMIQMVKVGEESGMLDTMLHKFADFIQADIDLLTQRLNQLLEPLIMVVLGVLIGGLVIGMYLPIFKLGNAI